MTEDNHYTVIGWKINFSKLYGELSEGEYDFARTSEDGFSIRVKFVVDKEGKVSYSEPRFE